MAHRTAVEKESRKRGREISPELIEELLGSLGVGAIKAIAGVPKLFISSALTKGSPGPLSRFPTTLSVKEALKAERVAGQRIKGSANIDRPIPFPGAGRRNIGGKRPPDKELEALALQKQTAQKFEKKMRQKRKERFKAMSKEAERLAKLSPEERARFDELSLRLQETVRTRLDKKERREHVNGLIDGILDLLDDPKGPKK